MKPLIPFLFVAAGLVAPAGGALASEELAKKYACLSCHAMDKKLIGPSYKDVAAKYKADKNAEAMLADKIKKGSQGAWPGGIPMPPNASVPDADLKALAKWVMSAK